LRKKIEAMGGNLDISIMLGGVQVPVEKFAEII
jgi:hypothetical protein